MHKEEVEKLKSIVESGGIIPKEKVDLYRLLILKDEPIALREQMTQNNPIHSRTIDRIKVKNQ